MTQIILLGPQDEQPSLVQTLADVGKIPSKTPVALITAGRESREAEDEDIVSLLDHPVRNLSLFARGETIFRDDPDLFAGLRLRHDHSRQLQALYRRRLDHAMDGACEVLETSVHPKDEWLVLEQLSERSAHLVKEVFEEAMAAVRELDHQHLLRLDELRDEFAAEWKPDEREAVIKAKQQVAHELSDCGALLVAGGHVVVLLNRLRLFGLAQLITAAENTMPVLAWSAGAMAMTTRVVAFHDRPPQGRGHAEVLESGLGLAPDVVALPHASQRLLLDDEMRVSILARRMKPAVCLALDSGSRADWDGQCWRSGKQTQRLNIDGTVTDWSTL